MGNAPATSAQFELLPFYTGRSEVGRVDYQYRMATTEVTTSQWWEFVTAYTAVHPDVNRLDSGFSGHYMFFDTFDPRIPPTWSYDPSATNVATEMSWIYAAKFCNWLTNGKAITVTAFETGAYDASLFTQNPDGTWNGPESHLPTAKFWIPTLDEWTKGMHYDPNRYGPGQEGYWLYPTSSDDVPVGGPPGTPGAQTGVGEYPGHGSEFYPVGSYPGTQSPWGLLDGSGGVSEYLELPGTDIFRATHGTPTWETSSFPGDRLDVLSGGFAHQPAGGLRLVSSVPSPSVLVTFIASFFMPKKRRR